MLSDRKDTHTWCSPRSDLCNTSEYIAFRCQATCSRLAGKGWDQPAGSTESSAARHDRLRGAAATLLANVTELKRVVLCMSFDAQASRHGMISLDINRQYALEHGFGFAFRYNLSYYAHLAPSWQKVGLLLEVLEASTIVDAAVWLDADAALLPQPDGSLSAILDHFMFGHFKRAEWGVPTSSEILFSEDRVQRTINNGVMAFKGTPPALALLRRLAGIGTSDSVMGFSDRAIEKILWLHKHNTSQQWERTRLRVLEFRCRYFMLRRNWEQGCIQRLWNNDVDGIRSIHSQLVPYGVLQTAVAPRHYLRPGAAVAHWMWGPSVVEPNDAHDRAWGLSALRDWITSTKASVRPKRLDELELLPMQIMRTTWMADAGNFTPYGRIPPPRAKRR